MDSVTAKQTSCQKKNIFTYSKLDPSWRIKKTISGKTLPLAAKAAVLKT